MSLDITPMVPAGKQLILGYGGGGFRIGEQAYAGPVIVFPDRTITWELTSVSEMSLDSLAPVIDAHVEIDILLLGCGPRNVMVDSVIRDGLRAAGVVLEPMDTGAACRTFNVLLAEERRVAAALLPVD